MANASFNLTFAVKKWFFSGDAVKKMMDRQTLKSLGSAGALVRVIAQRSMRYVTSLSRQQSQVAAGTRKRLTGQPTESLAGTPPHAIQPHPWIRKFLYFALDPAKMSVVIGPVRLGSGVNVPALHEFGGTRILKAKRRSPRMIGSSGEIRIGGRPGMTTRAVLNCHGWVQQVTYAKLRTPAQAARANRLNKELFGPSGGASTYVGHYLPRPFMGPALAAAQPGLSKFWATSVRAA